MSSDRPRQPTLTDSTSGKHGADVTVYCGSGAVLVFEPRRDLAAPPHSGADARLASQPADILPQCAMVRICKFSQGGLQMLELS